MGSQDGWNKEGITLRAPSPRHARRLLNVDITEDHLDAVSNRRLPFCLKRHSFLGKKFADQKDLSSICKSFRDGP
jgi:hypothetical protein